MLEKKTRHLEEIYVDRDHSIPTSQPVPDMTVHCTMLLVNNLVRDTI